jgi:hypothetical protein
VSEFEKWRDFVAQQLAVPPTQQRHPGIRLGSGRAGRPSRVELASFKRYLGTLELDEIEALGYCDCGRLLAGHPDLPKPGPLQSDHARRMEEPSDGLIGWNGAPVSRPRVALARRRRGKKFDFVAPKRRIVERAPDAPDRVTPV